MKVFALSLCFYNRWEGKLEAAATETGALLRAQPQ